MANVSTNLRNYANSETWNNGENIARVTGAGTPGGNSHAAAAVAADMLDGINALVKWVGSWLS